MENAIPGSSKGNPTGFSEPALVSPCCAGSEKVTRASSPSGVSFGSLLCFLISGQESIFGAVGKSKQRSLGR